MSKLFITYDEYEDEGCYAERDLDTWPNCSVPDCEYKACLSLKSDKCFPHTHGRNPEMSYEQYMATPPKEQA